jgi:hypothetical protein
MDGLYDTNPTYEKEILIFFPPTFLSIEKGEDRRRETNYIAGQSINR